MAGSLLTTGTTLADSPSTLEGSSPRVATGFSAAIDFSASAIAPTFLASSSSATATETPLVDKERMSFMSFSVQAHASVSGISMPLRWRSSNHSERLSMPGNHLSTMESGKGMKGRCWRPRPCQPNQTPRRTKGMTKTMVAIATEPKRPKKRAMIWSSL